MSRNLTTYDPDYLCPDADCKSRWVVREMAAEYQGYLEAANNRCRQLEANIGERELRIMKLESALAYCRLQTIIGVDEPLDRDQLAAAVKSIVDAELSPTSVLGDSEHE